MADEQTSAQQDPMDLMIGLVTGWLVSRAIHVAAELGIADLLSDGPKSVPQLAAATDTHPQSLYRLLRMLASYGVFAEVPDRRFEVNPLGGLLRSDAFRDFARMFGDADWNGYGALLHNIKTGEPAFKHVNGLGFFDYLNTHPDAQLRFDRGMANGADAENAAIASAYDFSTYKRIVDVGGGRGGFLAEILKAHRNPRGILYDQPQVVAHPDYLTKAGIADRCDVIGGNFFESVPTGADLYVLKRVMHDWSDDICEGILRRCRDAVSSSGRVVVIDSVVPPGNEPHLSKTGDLLMMVMLDGRERTEPEFRDLVARCGLKLTRIVPTPTLLSIVEAEPS
jgi:O-methyltransferase domain/Dimerisation domain